MAVFLLKVAAAVGFMATVLFTTMGEASWWLSAPWAAKSPGGARLGAARHARVRRLPRAFRLPPEPFLATRSGLMAVPLEAFAQLLARDDAKIDLAHGCLMIAQDAYPRLEVERYLATSSGWRCACAAAWRRPWARRSGWPR